MIVWSDRNEQPINDWKLIMKELNLNIEKVMWWLIIWSEDNNDDINLSTDVIRHPTSS